MGHALLPTHASAHLAGQDMIAAYLSVNKVVFIMEIVHIPILARK